MRKQLQQQQQQQHETLDVLVAASGALQPNRGTVASIG